MNDAAPRYAGLGDYLRLLRKQWLLILLPALIAAGVTYALVRRSAPTYETSAAVAVSDETQALAFLGTSVTPGTASGTLTAEIVAQTADTPQLARAVQRSLHSPLSIDELRGAVSLSVDAGSGLLDVTTDAGQPVLAARMADAFARAIAAQTNARAHGQFAAAVHSLMRRLGQLSPSDPSSTAERGFLQDEISRLEFLETNGNPASVAQLADVPGAPISPTPTKDALLGLLAGALLGLVLAFVRDSFDHRLRGSAAIRSELGWPLLGHVRSQAMGMAVQPSSVRDDARVGDVEAFRIMRRNLDSLAPGRERRAILITSALPEEGKSTVAASLALASAVTGRRTLLIEADLRRPALARRLGVPTRPGLAEYLAGRAEPQEILQTVAVSPPGMSINGNGNGNGHAPVAAAATAGANGHANRNGHDPLHASSGSAARTAEATAFPTNMLVCISAGAPTSGAAELLGSPRMKALLQEVTEVYDLVLVDTAPLLPVSDTLELLGLADGVVLCVRSGRTTREHVRAAKAALDVHFPAQSTGIVVTDLHPGDEPAGAGLYPYIYGSSTERVGV